MSLFSKFKNNLQKTSNFLSSNILNSFQNKKVDNETLEELESILISADISLDVVDKLINSVRKVKTSDQEITTTVLETLSKEIEIILQPREREILEESNKNKKILIFVGVNGSGKTTTIGKIANQIIITKLDGTAKGGALISIANKYEIPISYVGLGEKPEDLSVFSAKNFARSILNLEEKHEVIL